MNDLTNNLVRNYMPRLAIMVYAANYSDSSDRWKDVYLESHDVDNKGRVLAGKPLKQETIQGFVDVLFDQQQERIKIGGLIPENLLAFNVLPGGKYSMVWYTPAHLQQLHFATSLHIPSGQAWVPAMVWRVIRGKLEVYALLENKRPSAETTLYHAPFHNVSGGDVCLGSAKATHLKERTYDAEIKYWEDMFWLSKFTHLAHGNITKTNVNLIWNMLIKDKTLVFPADQLLPTEETLKHLLR